MGPSVLIVIPARRNSKSILRKNIKLLNGRPLIDWVVRAALGSTFWKEIIISSDDEKIEEYGRSEGVRVICRPEKLATDTASSESALLHVLKTIKNEKAKLPDITVMLQCTAPLTRSEDIDGTVKTLVGGVPSMDQPGVQLRAGSAFTATEFHGFLWWGDGNNKGLVGVNHPGRGSPRLMRQERQPQYLETGSVYAMYTKDFLKEKLRFCGPYTVPYMIPRSRVFEIDEPGDWEIAERLLEVHNEMATA